MNKDQLIVGITGTNGAGKGTIVDFLINKKGFKHFSAGDFITEEIIKRRLPVNRETMILVANDLRTNFGSGYIAEQLLERAVSQGENAVIESIRTMGEVETLRKSCSKFILLAVDADQKVRYERIKMRKSAKDNVSFEEFVSIEEKEMESSDFNKQNLVACSKAADYRIQNDGKMEELVQKVEEMLKIIEK
jgi:dephospho-CoA kinase